MRIGYAEDEQFPGQFNLWHANCARSLKGRAGQAALRELEASLVALPSKRLIANELDNGADCCAIGAIVRHRGLDPKTLETDFDTEYEMEEVGVELGIPRLVAWKLVEWNDVDFSHCSPEERYTRVLAWTRKLLAEPA